MISRYDTLTREPFDVEAVLSGGGIHYHYDVVRGDMTMAGNASSSIKKKLKRMGLSSQIIRRVAVAMYEGEINMVIHACGGVIDVYITPELIRMVLADVGPGIPDIEKAMTEGWSTAKADINAMGFGAGMGLPNMKNNTDEMRIETEIGVGTTVTMVIYI